MTELEWLFTPIPRSSKCMYTTLVQASIPLSGNFTLPRNRSPGFGSYPCDSRPFRLAFASASFYKNLTLPHRQTPWLVLQNARYNLNSSNILSLLDFKSFHPLLRVLFSFPSRYYCAIGLRFMFRVSS